MNSEISPKYVNITLSRFTSWDDLDEYITKLLSLLPGKTSFDILRWRFDDSEHWFSELSPIPFGCWIEVEWAVVG